MSAPQRCIRRASKVSAFPHSIFARTLSTSTYRYPPAHHTRFTTNEQTPQHQQQGITTHNVRRQQSAQQVSTGSSNDTSTAEPNSAVVCIASEFTSIKSGLLPNTLHEVQNTFGTINEITQADTLCQQGQYNAAIPLLKRAVEISVQLRDSLVAVYSHMLLARCYYLNSDLANERYERNEVIKLLDQLIKEAKNKVHSNGSRKMNSVNSNKTHDLLSDTIMFKQSISAYAVNLIRTGKYDECIELINTWQPRAVEYEAHDARVRSKAIAGVVYMMQKNAVKAERCFEDMHHIATENMLTDKRLIEGDSQVLLGLMYRHVSKSETKAKACFQRAVRVYQSRQQQVEPLDAGGVQLPIVYPLLYLNTPDSVKQALDISEKYLGVTHWLTIDALRCLATLYRNTDALTAEGLYRTALNRIDAPAPYVQQAEYWFVLADVLVDYADLLANMQWNNQSRVGEANKLIERLQQLYTAHPYVKSTVRHVTFEHEGKTADSAHATFKLKANDMPYVPPWFSERFTA